MRRSLLVCVFACIAANVSGQVPRPPARPVVELRLALSRFNNGTEGFSPAELSKKMVGFAQAARNGEFALAYYEDRGDNAVHPPLHLAYSTTGKPWKRADVGAPLPILEAVGALFIGKDYLLANTGSTSASRQIAVFDKSLAYLRSTPGAIAVAPLANDVVVFSESRPVLAPALRSSLALFEVHSGAVTPLYPGATPVEPSPSYKKLLTKLVADLNQAIPKGNSGRGYKEEWYAALSVARPEYDPVRDAVTFTETIAPTWPLPPLPSLSSQVETYQVVCGPMKKPSPKCVEGKRTIAPLGKAGR